MKLNKVEKRKKEKLFKNKTKKCRQCKKIKFLNKFYKDNKSKDGYRYLCKCCFTKNANTPSRKKYRRLYDQRPYVKEIRKKYYLKNKKKISLQKKEYRNRPEVIARSRIYHQQPEIKKYNREQTRKYSLTPHGIYLNLLKNAKRRKFRFYLSEKYFTKWYNSQKQVCEYCGRTSEEVKRSQDYSMIRERLSIDRIENKKGYVLNNIVLACMRCNITKNNYFTYDEMLKIAKIITKKEKY